MVRKMERDQVVLAIDSNLPLPTTSGAPTEQSLHGGPSGRSEALHRIRTPSQVHAEQDAGNGAGFVEQIPLDRQVTFTFEDICFSVPTKDKQSGEKATRMLLNHVYGQVRPGEVLFILGASGSGKTTLLDVLADRISHPGISGGVLVNGQPRHPASFKKFASYVQQDDALMGSLSVRETLWFASRMYLSNLTASEREARISTVLHQLGLTDAADVPIGTVFKKGISGGQKRRVSVGVELLKDPSIVLLDEFTSGLDAASTYQVTKRIRHLADEGRTIIATVHQPSSDVFFMSDKVLLLSAGRVIYFGDTSRIVDYFARLGFPCPSYANPADYIMHLINVDFYPSATEAHAMLDTLSTFYLKSPERASLMVEIAGVRDESMRVAMGGQPLSLGAGVPDLRLADVSRSPGVGEADTITGSPLSKMQSRRRQMEIASTARSAGWLRQFSVLSWRFGLNNLRNPGIFYVRLLMYLILSFMMATIFANLGTGTKDVQDRVNLLFFTAAFMSFMSIAVVPFLIEDWNILTREVANGMYSQSAFVVSNAVMSLPGVFIIALCTTAIIYPSVDFNSDSGRFGVFLVILFLTLFVAESLMTFFSALVPVFIIAMAMGAGAFGAFMLTQGFFRNLSSMPDGWIWLYYIGLNTYSFEWFMLNEFDGRENLDSDLWPTGDAVLEYFDLDGGSWVKCFVVLLGMGILYRFFTYLVLKYKGGKKH